MHLPLKSVGKRLLKVYIHLFRAWKDFKIEDSLRPKACQFKCQPLLNYEQTFNDGIIHYPLSLCYHYSRLIKLHYLTPAALTKELLNVAADVFHQVLSFHISLCQDSLFPNTKRIARQHRQIRCLFQRREENEEH